MPRDILVVDDHPAIPRLIRLFLKRTAYADISVRAVKNETEALIELDRAVPDLVLMDNRIPPHDTFRESLSVLVEASPGCPIVLLTGAPPPDFGNDPLDVHIHETWMKDDLNTEFLVEKLSALGF